MNFKIENGNMRNFTIQFTIIHDLGYKKIMYRFILPFIIIVNFYLFSVSAVYGLSLDIIDKVDIKAIKSISLIKNKDNFRADVVVQLSSWAKVALKFKAADFVITFKDEKGQDIFLGTTQPKEIIFPQSEEGFETLTDQKLEVFVGKNNIDTINRLIHLFNLIGNPNSEFTMVLSGTTEIGMKAKRGWIYQERIELENFTFHPTIQREVLFK